MLWELKNEKNATKTSKKVYIVQGQGAITDCQARNWFPKFCSGDTSLQDKLRPGPPTNECPGYDIKQSDSEVPEMQELWDMQSTPSLPSLPAPFWPEVVAPDTALSMG